MKIGMIFECGPQGADIHVCTILARKISADITIVSVPLGNKRKLIEECGVAAATLLASGCQRVIIVWDLYPAWRENGAHPCRHEDRESIFESLDTAGVNINHVALVCIEEELEAWLLADGRALSQCLSRRTHRVTVRDQRDCERVRNPKGALMKIYKQHTGMPYSDLAHARRIASAIPDLTRLRRVPAFVRFMQKVSPVPAK